MLVFVDVLVLVEVKVLKLIGEALVATEESVPVEARFVLPQALSEIATTKAARVINGSFWFFIKTPSFLSRRVLLPGIIASGVPRGVIEETYLKSASRSRGCGSVQRKFV